jgi:hypothetical protein
MTTNIRASMLPAYPDCSRRAAAKQFKKEIESAGFKLRETLPTVGAAFGTSIHSAAEFMLREKIETGEVGRQEDALDIAFSQFAEETATGAEWDDTTPNLNAARFQMSRIVAEIADFSEDINPKAVETEYVVEAGDGFQLSGHIDLITEEDVVRDLKSGALHRPYQAQLGAYSLLRRTHGHHVSGVAVDWIGRKPKTTPQTPVETTTYQIATCEKAAWATVQRIKIDLIQFRKSGDPWSFEANPMSMMCADRFCPAHSTKFCDMHITMEEE